MKLIRAEEAARNPENYFEGYPNMLLDDKTAIVTKRDFDRLPEYSSSVPTGVCEGKVWKSVKWKYEGYKRVGVERAALGSMEPHPKPDTVTQRFRELLVIE